MEIDRKPSPASTSHSSRSSPPNTPPSTSSSRMHIDLSSLPPLIQPSPPSNTLLITKLSNPAIFQPDTLQQIHSLLSQHAGAPLHTFSPLKSMRRIIVSLFATEAAIALRRALDDEEILGCRARVYFGIQTPILDRGDQHRYLAAPDAGRLFFISPPPSPPLGWTMRNEDPPNKAVHADDLASALAKLRSNGGSAWGGSPSGSNDIFGNAGGGGVSAADMMDEEADLSAADAVARRTFVAAGGANATVVYHPGDHGSRTDLPAVMVEDVSGDFASLEDGKRILTHTSRPPVELMLDEDMDMN